MKRGLALHAAYFYAGPDTLAEAAAIMMKTFATKDERTKKNHQLRFSESLTRMILTPMRMHSSI
jgi:hypothetical protein